MLPSPSKQHELKSRLFIIYKGRLTWRTLLYVQTEMFLFYAVQKKKKTNEQPKATQSNLKAQLL